jgi:hypothetical protein
VIHIKQPVPKGGNSYYAHARRGRRTLCGLAADRLETTSFVYTRSEEALQTLTDLCPTCADHRRWALKAKTRENKTMTPEQQAQAREMVRQYSVELIRRHKGYSEDQKEKLETMTREFCVQLKSTFPDVDPFELGWYCASLLGVFIASEEINGRAFSAIASTNHALNALYAKPPR